jgi:hypothetical protein
MVKMNRIKPFACYFSEDRYPWGKHHPSLYLNQHHWRPLLIVRAPTEMHAATAHGTSLREDRVSKLQDDVTLTNQRGRARYQCFFFCERLLVPGSNGSLSMLRSVASICTVSSVIRVSIPGELPPLAEVVADMFQVGSSI